MFEGVKKILLILLLPVIALGQTNYTIKIDEYMKAEADIYNFSGTVLVKKNNKIIYLKAFGLADMEWDVPNTINTKYRICSISKTFSSACILMIMNKMRKLEFQLMDIKNYYMN